MKEINEILKYKLQQTHVGINKKSLKWNEIYDTEDELVKAMFHEKILVENAPYYKICRGYEYIKSFRVYYDKHGALTEKQMVQLKRLAAEIAYQIYCV